jgi:rhamnosyltransferase
MKATIALLTLNADPWLRELLDSVRRQKTDFEYEVLLIDSGSTDKTLEITAEYPEVRLHQIPNSEFGHGKTRNLAAQLSQADFMVYLTHDAVPAHDYWLTEMLRPFDLNPKVACVFGKQIPRFDCCPTVKRDIINLFASFGPDHFTMVAQANPILGGQASKDAIGFFSDVNSAVRRDLLVGEIPYRNINYAEDQAFGRDVTEAGLYKVYAPLGSVIHSHSYPPFKYLRRMYDEMVGLKAATGQTMNTPMWYHIAWALKATVGDWRFIRRDGSYRLRTKVRYFVQAPLYNAFRRLAIQLSVRKELPSWAHNLLSLERQHKKKAA